MLTSKTEFILKRLIPPAIHEVWQEVVSLVKPGTVSLEEISAFHFSNIRPAVRRTWRPTVLEIGVLDGGHTRMLLNACLSRLGTLISVDPAPSPTITNIMRMHPLGRIVNSTSLEALPNLIQDRCRVDVAVIDGDHNYYTVLNELAMVELLLTRDGVVFIHDVGWPYARRDLYYEPDRIPSDQRHPYARAGMVRGQSNLAALGGMNPHLLNACHEGGPKNGVLTAIEDFLHQRPKRWSLEINDQQFGLAILRRNVNNV